MTHLPKHPFTGLTALGLRRDGRPIWPVLGGSGETPPAANPPGPTPPAAQPPAANPADPPADPDDKPLGPNGEKALNAERKAREALEKELAALAPLKKLAEALGGGKPGEKTDVQQLTERFEQQQQELATERTARFRSEVAVEKKLTPGQAALLAGTTREEIAAHADKLLAEFGKAAEPDPGRRGGMRPDPAQGARPGGKPSAKDAGLAEAQRRFAKKT